MRAVHTGSDSMVVQPAHLRLNVCNSSTAGAKEDCIFCLFGECSSVDIGGLVPGGMYGIGDYRGEIVLIGGRDNA